MNEHGDTNKISSEIFTYKFDKLYLVLSKTTYKTCVPSLIYNHV